MPSRPQTGQDRRYVIHLHKAFPVPLPAEDWLTAFDGASMAERRIALPRSAGPEIAAGSPVASRRPAPGLAPGDRPVAALRPAHIILAVE